jgi:hypothetical protein
VAEPHPTGASAKDPFRRLQPDAMSKHKKGSAHVFGKHHRCVTDTLGYKSPRNHGPAEIVVDASEGFIPLWKRGSVLRWRFNERSFIQFADIAAAKDGVRSLMSHALLQWGDAIPIKFAERSDAWDFEVVVREKDDCDIDGCTLASAFFPDQGRHKLYIYPEAFKQTKKEQVDTLAHEFGHVFGLRHFFAKLKETRWASEVFGKHSPFSIMNYGSKSVMTARDRSDLKLLYSKVWAGDIDNINGTPIKLVKPYHTT